MDERIPEPREWAEAEHELYPVITLRPDLYEVCAGLVRSLADHLATVPDIGALAATYRTTDFERNASEAGIDQSSIPPDVSRRLVRGAAFALRAREIETDEKISDTRRAIERAKRAGEPTAVLWKEGENELWPPYRRVEMSVASGRAIATSTELDPETMVSKFFLVAVQLDPETGEGADEEPLVPEKSFTHPEEWHAAAAELRASVLGAE